MTNKNWSPQEISDADTFCRMWPDGIVQFSRNEQGNCYLSCLMKPVDGYLSLGKVDLFPSVKRGEYAILNEIAREKYE